MGFKQAGTFKQQSSVMGSAIKYCTEAGLSGRLSEELKAQTLLVNMGHLFTRCLGRDTLLP